MPGLFTEELLQGGPFMKSVARAAGSFLSKEAFPVVVSRPPGSVVSVRVVRCHRFRRWG